MKHKQQLGKQMNSKDRSTIDEPFNEKERRLIQIGLDRLEKLFHLSSAEVHYPNDRKVMLKVIDDLEVVVRGRIESF